MTITDEDAFDPAQLIRIGRVESVDLAQARCTVSVDELVTGPILWMESRAGATRSWSPPSEGEQVLLICPYGELAGAIALRGLLSDSYPAAGSSLEEVILFSDGARIAYDPESHTLTATLPGGSTVNLTADQVNISGDVAIDGNLSVDGDTSCTGTVTADEDVIGDGKSLKDHRHTGVTAGGAQSGPPA